MSHAREAVRADPQPPHAAAARPPLGLDIRQLAALLGAADEAGCAPVVLRLVRNSETGRRLFQRLRQLAERLGWAGGWGYPARLLECIDVLIEAGAAWSQPADVLGAPVPPPEHLLLAAQERGLGQGPGSRGVSRRLLLRLAELQREADARVAEHGELAALGLRVRRLEEKVAQLLAAGSSEPALGLCTSTGTPIVPPALRAEALARLLGVALRGDLEAPCLALIRQSGRGAQLYELLAELKQAVGERFTWDYLAQLLRRVEGWEQTLAAGARLVLRSPPGEPLEDLEAAARLRLEETRKDRPAALQTLVQRLGRRRELIRKRQPKAPEPAQPAALRGARRGRGAAR